MSGSGSITRLAKRLAAGDNAAADAIWRIFVSDLVNLARRRMGRRIRQRLDPDDVVQSAFNSFFQGFRAGDFDVRDRDDLKNLLVLLVVRKSCNAAVHHSRKRRDCRLEHKEAAHGDAYFINESPVSTPDEIAACRDQVEYLIGKLSNDELRTIVLFKFQGMTNKEISQSLTCCLRTVERKIDRIRDEWRVACDIEV